MTIRRVKPIARSRIKRRKGTKAGRETPALDAFRFAVFERANGYCEVMVVGNTDRPFPFYDRITRDDRLRICGKDGPHRGDNAHHVWPEDRDEGRHEPERGLWLCFTAHNWVHAHPGELLPDGTVTPDSAKALGLLRPILPEES